MGDLKINDEGVAEQGLLIRHLVLPNNIAGSKKVLGFIANISKNSYINIMAQYRPAWKAHKYPKVDRLVNKEEYRKVKKYAEKLGLVIH